MKYNLKNFPNVHEYQYRKKVHDWIEGFKKELLEMQLESEQWLPKHRAKNKVKGEYVELALIELVNKILGE